MGARWGDWLYRCTACGKVGGREVFDPQPWLDAYFGKYHAAINGQVLAWMRRMRRRAWERRNE